MKTITRKSLLRKSKVEYANYSLNHVLGCKHGCKFPCYGLVMAKAFGWVKSYEEWIQPRLVSNALELLEEEIPKFKDDIENIHLCFMTDPFMYWERGVRKMSLQIIERLARENIPCRVLTKGILPKELIDTERYGNRNEYGITIISLDDHFRMEFEPNTAPYYRRLEALKYLHRKGLRTWVSIEPYPTPNLNGNQDLEKLLQEVIFADKIIFGKLNYNKRSKEYHGMEEFYEYCAKKVIEFCEDAGIEYHIKEGTRNNMK